MTNRLVPRWNDLRFFIFPTIKGLYSGKVGVKRRHNMSKPDTNTPPQGEIVIYHAEDGNTRIEVRFVDETVWPAHRHRSAVVRHPRAW